MLKLYKLCKLYNLHIEVKYDNEMDGMIFIFYDTKTKKRYEQCVPCIEIEYTRNIELLEDSLFRKVIDAFELDNDL